MKKSKTKRIISFESDINRHITEEETFEVADAMYKTLSKSCPGCSMSVLSTLISMLAVSYSEDYTKRKEIFEYERWIKCIIDEATTATNHYERAHTPHNN
jgi:hypothetical protein